MSYSPQLRLEDYSQYAGVGTIYQNNNVDLIEVDSINNSIGNGVDNNSKLRSQIETHEKVQLVFDESDSNDSNSTNSLSIVSQNDDVNDYKSRIMTTTIVTTTVTSVNSSSKNSVSSHKSAPSLSKFLSFNLKGKFNRSRSPKHVRMLSELKIPVPENNETIIFMSKVKKLDSHTFKKSSNNFIILTKKWLYGFKNIEKASKIFVNSPPPLARDNIDYNSIIISTKNLPSENIVLSLSTVYSVREVSSPEKHIRIDYILGPKNHDHITILSPDIELHHQWLITLKSTIRNADSVGPYLTLNQREWFMKKLKLLDDLADDDENNLVSFRVLLKSSIENDIIKDTNFPVIFILGKNNVYFIPFDLIGNDDDNNDNNFINNNNHKKQSSFLSKEIEFHKYQYPLLCLKNIFTNKVIDTFQLTFKNSLNSMKRSLVISSIIAETIILEIRMAIDSITYWWPNPGYKLKTPKNLQSMILSPERESNKTSEILMGFDRMIEAQCHANKVNRSRINFNVEYVLGSESVMLGLEVNNLPFRFILLPPKDSKSGHNDVYSNQELVTIFNSLIYHPLLHEIILRDINLFELQIQPGPKRHKGRNMLGSVLYDILLSNPRLVKLDLTSCGITSETVSIIGQAFMSGQSCLECLLLSDNPITREGAQALASGLTGHKSAIKELDISNCKLTHDSIEYILHALDTNDPSKLEVLNLSNNMCDLESNILTELLSKTISLRSLNLRNCSKFFIHMITPVISIETLGNTQLTTLNLGGVSLNDHNHINALYAYIQSPAFAKLRFFNIEDCNLGGEMIAIILSYVTTSPNSKKIRVWAGGNHITRTLQGFKELCNAINNNWTPTWLSLRYTMFGSNLEMVNDFLQTFCENSVIKYLDLSYPYFNAPIASRVTKTVNKACEVIGKVFRENQSIRELHLNGDSERRFGPSLSISLSGLKDNDTLEKLYIKGNAIGDRGALSLSEALKSNRKLKSLDIDENEIGIDGYSAINYVFTSGSNLSVKHFTYPIQDLETYENKRDLSFNPPTIKRMALEKEKRKANLRRVLDEIMDSIKQFNNFDSTNDAFNE
ncbi:unnamed protein product [Rhizophagus irregularis]|nr:unnamed protein product [Rhizophagus irregularis]CAB5376347.1 unnamed protein product [Rhizophagus irregularis]